MDSFFSVIIPTLNEDEYLPRLLTCLQKQTFKRFEVIVVDGKSIDRTKEYALSFKEILPDLSFHQSEKRNVAYQRNLGASVAKSDYYIFFDADVQIPKNFLKSLYNIIQKNKNMFLSTYVKPDSDQKKDWLLANVANIVMDLSNTLEKPAIGGHDIIIHKSVFNQIKGFNDKLKMAEDHDLAQRCLNAGVRLKILHSPRLVVSLRRFRHMGYLNILKRYTQSQLFYLLRGPIKKALYDYPMGGHVYKKDKVVTVKTAERFEKWLLKTVRKILEV